MGYLRDFGFEMQEFTAFEISDFTLFNDQTFRVGHGRLGRTYSRTRNVSLCE
jgi:hypothetical protein